MVQHKRRRSEYALQCLLSLGHALAGVTPNPLGTGTLDEQEPAFRST